ncbi:unnamed protein product [Rangifer tarandus platyrhynchus]|uniref:Uncharacterized protein n=2 Tax=Rangifer tarandus platyrhynchus TaxID=3082113 RepID=A0AC59Z5R1_RANTA|nr:unnamed protein product [Rangifer tarandus platyrhynchus]
MAFSLCLELKTQLLISLTCKETSWGLAFTHLFLSLFESGFQGFPGGLDGYEAACSVGDLGSITGLGKSPGEGNGNSLQYRCLETSMERGVWRATVHGVINSQTQLGDFTFFLSGRTLHL